MRLRTMFFWAAIGTVTTLVQGMGQSIVQVIPLPNTTYWLQAYGLAADSTSLFVSSGTSSAVYNRGFIYVLDFNGNPADSITTGISTYSQGLAWDGSYFWYVKGSGSSVRIYKISTSGALVDSIIPPSGWYLGGACWDGTGLWVSNYYPNNLAALYKYDVTTKTIIDTVATYGLQPQGIAWDGQYLYYAMDNNDGDVEKIYQVNLATGDTVRSWYLPEGPSSNMSPRGLAWDGHYLWLIAEPVGGSSGRSLYKYDLGGSGTPDISLSRDSVFVGYRRIGGTYRDSILIQNLGTAPLRIDSVGPNAPPTWSRSLSSTPPFTIQPNSSATLYVDFQPPLFGQHNWSLPIYSNDPDESVKTFRASGFAIYPVPFIVAPSSYDFSSRRIGSSSYMSFSIWNQGGPQLVISSMTLGSSIFSLDSVTFPITIDSLHTTPPLRVWFRPTAATAYLDTLKIVSNASNSPVVNVILTGSGNGTPAPLGAIMWEGYVPDNPYTSFDDYQTKSIKQIEDVNNDGVNDVIVASGNYLVTCFNGNSSVTADVLWTFNTGTNNNNTGSVDWEDALQIRDDIDGDGVSDVVFGCAGGNESVYTVSGRTGQLIWVYGDSINYSLGDIMGVRVDRDYNGDGVKDVLVSASGTANFGGRHSAICLNGLNGQVIFSRQLGSNFTYDIVSTEEGGAIGAGNDGGPYEIAGLDTAGNLSWSYPLSGSLNAVWSLREIPDINGDGAPDIVGLYGFSAGLVALDAGAGASIWTASLGGSNNGRIILLDDLNHNGYVDFTLSAPQVLYRLDTHAGDVLWSTPLNSSYIRGIDYLSDVNGDGIRDIAVATQQPGKIVVVNGANGTTLFEYTFGTTITERGDRVATLSSIDGNASTEFVGGNRQGRVVCFSGGQNTVGVAPAPTTLPTEFSVSQNYPNPFNPSTTIEVRLPVQSDLSVAIYDVVGKKVRDFVYQHLPAGTHQVRWDGANANGTQAASGVYFCQVRANDHVAVRRMLLLK